MICPRCAADALHVLGHIELGRIGAIHENTVQRARCDACRATFLCLYEEERSLSMNRDNRVSHQAYRLNGLLWRAIAVAFEDPKPKKSAQWRCRVGQKMRAHRTNETLAGPVAILNQQGTSKLANGDQ